MKLSKQIKNSLLSIDTIIGNALGIAEHTGNTGVTISQGDAKRILEWANEHIENLRDIEKLSR